MLEHTSPIQIFYLSGLQRNNFERVMGGLAIFDTVDIRRSTGFNCQNSFPSKLDKVFWQVGHELC